MHHISHDPTNPITEKFVALHLTQQHLNLFPFKNHAKLVTYSPVIFFMYYWDTRTISNTLVCISAWKSIIH
jgi:hypothetical protein